jgi:peptidoglycan/LPS O-acetylase OafA/YrhL
MWLSLPVEIWELVEGVVFYMTIPAVLLACIGVILDLLQWQPSALRAWRVSARLALAIELAALAVTVFLATGLANADQGDFAVGIGLAGFALVLFTMGSVAWLLVLNRLHTPSISCIQIGSDQHVRGKERL